MNGARLFLSSDVTQLERLLGERSFSKTTTERARYLTRFLREGGTTFMENGGNLRTAVAVAGNSVVPLVVNDGGRDQCYLVSPYVHYVAYLIEETRKMRPPVASLVVRAALHALGSVMKALAFDRAVSINNWLFTTSLEQALSSEELAAMKELLLATFPDYAFVYRGLDLRDEATLRALDENGFRPLIHRPVLEWSPDEHHSKGSRRAVHRDMRLTEGRPFGVRAATSPSAQEFAAIAAMYRALYIEKHSRHNVHYTERFFRATIETGINYVDLVTLDDRVCAFITMCPDGERVISALTGYDAAVATKQASPYAAAIGCAFRNAKSANQTLFLSTGVSEFKRRRGAREHMEYEAFFVEHLPIGRRAPWFTIQRFLELATRHINVSDI